MGGILVGDTTTEQPTAKYEAVFDYLLEGCQIIGKDYRYVYVNEAVAKQGRRNKDELIGRPMAECYPGIEKTEMFTRLRACIEYGQPQHMENEFRFPDGVVGWFELRIEPVPEGAIILSIDITERKEAAERLRRLNELRTIYMKIVLEELAERAEDIRAAFGGADPPDLDMKEVNLGEFWQPLKADCARGCKLAEITFICNEPVGSLPMLQGDGNKLRLVMEALLRNAQLYTSAGGSVTVDIDRQGGSLLFKVTDTGMGIPQDEQSRVLTRFLRSKKAEQANPEGTGVSLVVANYYVRLHGGTMGFSSREGQGSSFWFTIPEPHR